MHLPALCSRRGGYSCAGGRVKVSGVSWHGRFVDILVGVGVAAPSS